MTDPPLQPDQPIVITIDGPAGTGKSTVAHQLAGRLGLEFLDTGAMYRGAALTALEHSIDPADGPAVADALQRHPLYFDWKVDPPTLIQDGRDISSRIRELDVSSIVSIVAAQPSVRDVLVEQQRRIAQEHPRLVTEGRDQGSVVFPDAPIRFYLDADVKVRAGRRVAQMQAAGKTEVDADHIYRDLLERDRIDSTRRDGPLTRPREAIMIETDHRSAEQVVDAMEQAVRERLAQPERPS